MGWLIDELRAKFRESQYEFSLHAADQSILRKISTLEIQEAVATGEILEDYPTDKYGPTCLILGFTAKGRPLHVQCTYPTRQKVKIVTVYEPDPAEWIDLRTRRGA